MHNIVDLFIGFYSRINPLNTNAEYQKGTDITHYDLLIRNNNINEYYIITKKLTTNVYDRFDKLVSELKNTDQPFLAAIVRYNNTKNRFTWINMKIQK